MRTVNNSTSNAPSPFQVNRNTPNARMIATDSQIADVAMVLAVLSCIIHFPCITGDALLLCPAQFTGCVVAEF